MLPCIFLHLPINRKNIGKFHRLPVIHCRQRQRSIVQPSQHLPEPVYIRPALLSDKDQLFIGVFSIYHPEALLGNHTAQVLIQRQPPEYLGIIPFAIPVSAVAVSKGQKHHAVFLPRLRRSV